MIDRPGDISYQPPEEKRVYLDFVARVRANVASFIERYPKTAVIDLDEEAHQFAASLALALHSSGAPVNHYPLHQRRRQDIAELVRLMRTQGIVAVEYTKRDDTLQCLRDYADSLKRKGYEIPGVLYVADVESDSPILEIINDGRVEASNPKSE